MAVRRKTKKQNTLLLFIFIVIGLFFLLTAGLIYYSKSKALLLKATTGIVPHQYIVVLKPNVVDPQSVATDMARTHGLLVSHRYSTALKGYAAMIPDEKLEKVKSDPRVAFISEDRVVRYQVLEQAAPTRGKKPKISPTPSQLTPNGVKRIGVNSINQGINIGVAVIDTGIQLTHPDLAANIIANKTCVTGTSSGNDDNGHGTHVAGTVGAINNVFGVVGVASQVKLVAVKVLDSLGNGTNSSVICGVDWITQNSATYNILVANLSLAGGGSSDNNCGYTNNDPLHTAICNSRNSGITYVVAAGNGGSDGIGDDVKDFVPAAYDDAVITVSALADSDGQPGGSGASTFYGADDTFASFSNYGSTVDLGAPGVDIYSTYIGGGYTTLTGTSMSSPHVAGSAALYIKSHPGALWNQVRDGLKSLAEPLNAGHTDPSGLHLEPIVKAGSL